MKFLADVAALLIIGSRYLDIPEAELRHFLFIPFTIDTQQLLVHTPGNTAFNGIHQSHSTLITDIVQPVVFLEVHQIDIFVFETQKNTQRIGNRIIRLLHHHIFQLAHHITFLRFSGIAGNHTSDDNVRIKILTHYIDRKIIVDTAIVSQDRVYFDRFKHHRKAHGCTHRITQVAAFHNQGTLVVDIRSYTTKRDKQTVEVCPTGSCSLCIQIQKDDIHLDRVHHAGR